MPQPQRLCSPCTYCISVSHNFTSNAEIWFESSSHCDMFIYLICCRPQALWREESGQGQLETPRPSAWPYRVSPERKATLKSWPHRVRFWWETFTALLLISLRTDRAAHCDQHLMQSTLSSSVPSQYLYTKQGFTYVQSVKLRLSYEFLKFFFNTYATSIWTLPAIFWSSK